MSGHQAPHRVDQSRGSLPASVRNCHPHLCHRGRWPRSERRGHTTGTGWETVSNAVTCHPHSRDALIDTVTAGLGRAFCGLQERTVWSMSTPSQVGTTGTPGQVGTMGTLVRTGQRARPDRTTGTSSEDRTTSTSSQDNGHVWQDNGHGRSGEKHPDAECRGGVHMARKSLPRGLGGGRTRGHGPVNTWALGGQSPG